MSTVSTYYYYDPVITTLLKLNLGQHIFDTICRYDRLILLKEDGFMKRPLRKYEGSLPYFLGCMGVAAVLCAIITYFALSYLVLVLENNLSLLYEDRLSHEMYNFVGNYFNKIEKLNDDEKIVLDGIPYDLEKIIELGHNKFESNLSDLISYAVEREYPCMVYSQVKIESDSIGNIETNNLDVKYFLNVKAPKADEVDDICLLMTSNHITKDVHFDDPGESFSENHVRYMKEWWADDYAKNVLDFGANNYIAFSFRSVSVNENNDRMVWDYYVRVNNVYWIVWKDNAVKFILFYVFSLALAALAGWHLFIRSSNYEGNAYRRHMMSAMIHDLKSPLMVISSYAENLKANVHSEKKDYYAEEIIKGAGKLNDMIMNNLHLLALENEQIDLKLGKYDIVKIASDKLNSYEDILKARNIETTVKGKIMARLDQRQMQAAFGNIISNAVNYCKDGGNINIIATRDGRDFKLTVSNTSDPVDKDLLEKIWEPFVKGDNARSNSRSSGLGMSIAKGVFEIHKWICKADYDEKTKMFSVSVLIPRKRL